MFYANEVLGDEMLVGSVFPSLVVRQSGARASVCFPGCGHLKFLFSIKQEELESESILIKRCCASPDAVSYLVSNGCTLGNPHFRSCSDRKKMRKKRSAGKHFKCQFSYHLILYILPFS